MVEPDYGHQSEENPQNIAAGGQFAAQVINAVISGPGWPQTLLDTDPGALACNTSGPGTIPPPGSVTPPHHHHH